MNYKTLILLFFGLGHFLSPSIAQSADSISLRITEAHIGGFIAGEVRNLETVADDEGLRLLLYIKTDNWYIHSHYFSHDIIRQDGYWEMNSVRRQARPCPDSLAAVLVDLEWEVEVVVKYLKDLPYHAVNWIWGDGLDCR